MLLQLHLKLANLYGKAHPPEGTFLGLLAMTERLMYKGGSLLEKWPAIWTDAQNLYMYSSSMTLVVEYQFWVYKIRMIFA